MNAFAPQFDNAQFEKLSKDATKLGQENFDAAVKSATIFAKGLEDFYRTGFELLQTTAEKQSEFAKQALSSKTINEFSEIQTKVAQANFDDFMSSATKLSELAVKTLSEASEPVSEQVTKVVNSVQKAA